jgi:hypothetical protein
LLAAIQGWSKEDGRNGIRSSKLSNIAAFRRLGLSGQPATQVRRWKKPGLDRVAGKRISPTSALLEEICNQDKYDAQPTMADGSYSALHLPCLIV